VNELQKTILNFVLCFFLGVTITLSITIPIFITSSRRADNKLGELSARLQESDRRCSELESTIMSCREPIERITDFTRRGNETLSGIIENLKRIRDEVQILENCLYSIDSSSGNNNWNDSVSDIPVE
jgi:septal ring factor EnvC (AmiA/AmiB activator)